MKKKINEEYGISIGSSTLIMIFAIVCLVVFSLLTYKTAINEYNLAKKSSNEVKLYYEADSKAINIKRKIEKNIKHNKTVKGLVEKQENKNGNIYYSYSVNVSKNKKLSVKLLKKEKNLTIVKWKEINLVKDEYKNKLEVIGGNM